MTKAKPKKTAKKIPKKDVGQPTVITDGVLHILRECFLIGCSDEEACNVAQISTSAFYEYQKKTDGYKERKALLKTTPIYTARKSVVNAVAIYPDLALKYLERKLKSEFSTKQEVDTTGTITVNINDRDSGTL